MFKVVKDKDNFFFKKKGTKTFLKPHLMLPKWPSMLAMKSTILFFIAKQTENRISQVFASNLYENKSPFFNLFFEN
jgi:hypothetical protein